MSYKGKKKKIIDTKHKNPFNPMNIGPSLNTHLEDKTILSNMSKKDIVFGSYAFNTQVKYPFPYAKTPKGDIDIKSKKPLFTALKIERALDNNANMNNYHIEVLEHDKGKTFRVKSKSRNKVVADIGRLDKKIPTKIINGVLFETIKGRKNAVKKLLKSPDARYRREKDTKMLGVIERYDNQIVNRKNVGFDISKPLVKDTDRDGVPDYIDCEKYNPEKQGPIHDWLEKRRLRKQMENAPDTVREDMAQDYGEAETRTEQVKQQVGERIEQYRENIKEGFDKEQIGKNFNRVASDYAKRADSVQSNPQMMEPGRSRVKDSYLIPAPRKQYWDEEKQEHSSIPHFKRDKYVAFSPPTVGGNGMFKPHTISAPYLLEQKKKKLIEYLNNLRDTGQTEKFNTTMAYLKEKGIIT